MRKKPKETTIRTFGVERISLADESCSPSHQGQASLDEGTILTLLSNIDSEWTFHEDNSIERAYAFANFVEALAFVNQAGEICEAENHHAEFSLGWGAATVKIWTHDVGGLTRSDFILAAKIDQL